LTPRAPENSLQKVISAMTGMLDSQIPRGG
jgi:hypothetical protein